MVWFGEHGRLEKYSVAKLGEIGSVLGSFSCLFPDISPVSASFYFLISMTQTFALGLMLNNASLSVLIFD